MVFPGPVNLWYICVVQWIKVSQCIRRVRKSRGWGSLEAMFSPRLAWFRLRSPQTLLFFANTLCLVAISNTGFPLWIQPVSLFSHTSLWLIITCVVSALPSPLFQLWPHPVSLYLWYGALLHSYEDYSQNTVSHEIVFLLWFVWKWKSKIQKSVFFWFLHHYHKLFNS